MSTDFGLTWSSSRRSQSGGLGSDGRATLRLLTANLLYRSRRVGRFLDCIAAEDPDLLMLQELTPGVANELSRALAATHPHALLEPDEGADGFGVFARWAITPVQNEGGVTDWRAAEGDSRYPDAPARDQDLLARGCRFLQRSRLGSPWGAIELFNTHLVSPVDARAIGEVGVRGVGRLREAQAAVIVRALADTPEAGRSRRDAIVAGDFNAWPGRPAVRAVAAVARDAWAAGSGGGATWPRRAPWLNLPAPPVFRLDYCFLSGRLEASRAYVYRAWTGSDHCPVMVDVTVSGSVRQD